jgi:hypothetical protein
MDLRTEINAADRGTKARITRETKLSKPTILHALDGSRCSPATARDIATAFGQPDRWHELVVITRPPRSAPQDPPPSLDLAS